MSQKDPERIEESEINKVVVCIMADHDTGRMKVGEIRAKLPHYARLSSKDGTTLRQVRNLKSHHNSAGNIFGEGYVEWIRRGIWEITGSGRSRAKHLRESGFYNQA
jgi:hypothetical protein